MTKWKSSGQNGRAMPKPACRAQQASIASASSAPAPATSSPRLPCPGACASSAVRATWKKESGSSPRLGGTRTYLPRPSQKTKVARNISTPGMPNATAGPKPRRNSGISSEAKKLPKLIVQ